MTFEDIVTTDNQSAARRLATESATRLVLIDRHGPRSVLFQCPCGCGDVLVINVDHKLRQAWRLRRGDRGISLMPSVWRTTGCRSHFILWENSVWWCRYDPEDETEPAVDEAWPEELARELRRAWYDRWMK